MDSLGGKGYRKDKDKAFVHICYEGIGTVFCTDSMTVPKMRSAILRLEKIESYKPATSPTSRRGARCRVPVEIILA